MPAGVRSATFEVVGGAGGSGPADNPPGGRGGGVRAVVSLVPRSTLQINVGESGGSTWYGAGGWNGGGNGGAFSHSNIKNLPSSGGGGASDVRTSPYSLTSRFLVGGGGGGAGSWTTVGTQGQPGAGGAGGGSTGGGAGRGFQGQNGSGSLFGAGGGGGAAASPGSPAAPQEVCCGEAARRAPGTPLPRRVSRAQDPMAATGGWLRDSLDGGDCDSGGFGGGGGGGFAGGGGGGGGISAGAGGGGGSGFGPATSTSFLGEPGADGVVRVTYLTPGTPTWVNLGGTMASPPAVAKQQGTGLVDSRQDVFYLDADSNVVHRPITTGLVGPPENLRGPTYPGTSRPGHLRFGSSLAAVSWSYGRLDLFGRGTDDALWHRWYDGAWSGWERLSEAGRLASSPTVASWAPGAARRLRPRSRHGWARPPRVPARHRLGGLGDPPGPADHRSRRGLLGTRPHRRLRGRRHAGRRQPASVSLGRSLGRLVLLLRHPELRAGGLLGRQRHAGRLLPRRRAADCPAAATTAPTAVGAPPRTPATSTPRRGPSQPWRPSAPACTWCSCAARSAASGSASTPDRTRQGRRRSRQCAVCTPAAPRTGIVDIAADSAVARGVARMRLRIPHTRPGHHQFGRRGMVARSALVALVGLVPTVLNVVGPNGPQAAGADGTWRQAGSAPRAPSATPALPRSGWCPAGVRWATFQVVGAGGGVVSVPPLPGTASLGGGVEATVKVVPGSTTQIFVGGRGGDFIGGAGGWNGGGNGGGTVAHGAGGGGASDVRIAPFGLAMRILVGGGGGGQGARAPYWMPFAVRGLGGDGGGSTGGGWGPGQRGEKREATGYVSGGGGGGTINPGSGGIASPGQEDVGCRGEISIAGPGRSGGLGVGGDGGYMHVFGRADRCDGVGGWGGGGGGGLVGGGGGGAGIAAGAGGGGGSGFGPGTSTTFKGEPLAAGVVRGYLREPQRPAWVSLGGTLTSAPTISECPEPVDRWRSRMSSTSTSTTAWCIAPSPRESWA